MDTGRIIYGPLLIIIVLFTTLDFPLTSANGIHSYGNSCIKHKECNSSAGLSCLKGVCQCSNPETLTYSKPAEACVVKVGRRCGGEDDDNETEVKSTLAGIANLSLCVENAECRKLKLRKWCRCKEGFIGNSEGTSCDSMARFNETCDDLSHPCEMRSGTVCIQGLCQCPFGKEQFFDPQEKKCISYANGNCSITKLSPCVSNAKCVNVQLRTGYTESSGVKKIHTKLVTQCHCVKGYSENKQGFCMASAGTECDRQRSCNSEAFLTCIDGKCKCRNPLYEMVDENSGKCVSLVGSICHKEDERPGGLSCVENAECINGQCECRDGYSVTSKKTCLLSYKQNCMPNQCNSFGGLACVNEVCECFDSHLVYDESTKSCVGLSSSSE